MSKGEVIKKLRTQNGMTQDDLASLLGTTKQESKHANRMNTEFLAVLCATCAPRKREHFWEKLEYF